MQIPSTENSAKKRYLTVLLIVFTVVILDYFTKRYAEASLVPGVAKDYLNGFFRIVYAENTGAFLGMGGQLGKVPRFLIFTAATSLFLVFVAFTTLRQKDIDSYELVAVSLIIGGGIGNLIDRVVRVDGAVIDFMNMGIGSLRTGIFNVADVALTAGVLLWLLPLRRSARAMEVPEVTS